MAITWIEASAGTGKTFSLVEEVIQLVQQRGFSVESVLLVTFTEKATAELKSRIRNGLRQAWKNTRDPRLAQALEDLPSMTITTIHGFCRSLLSQFPLESGVSFAPEMVDQDQKWRRLLRDYHRTRLTELDTNLLVWAGLEDEEELLELAVSALNQRLFSVPVVHPTPAELDHLHVLRTQIQSQKGPFWEVCAPLCGQAWPQTSEQAFGEEAVNSWLHGRNHRKPYQLVRQLAAAQTARDLMPLLTSEALKALRAWDEGGSVWKKAAQPPFEGNLELARQGALAWVAAVEAAESALPHGLNLGAALRRSARWQLLRQFCTPVLERQSDRELTFHDLIERVSRLVSTSPTLVKGAREHWKAILVDEFQDTDEQQWSIFSKLFVTDHHHLVLVGDPKQSIYRFRGADLSVYQAAKRTVQNLKAEIRVLDKNFRSTPEMISAVNQHFTSQPWAESTKQHGFAPVAWGGQATERLVRTTADATQVLPALVSWSAEHEDQWHGHVVETVAQLLDGQSVLDDGERPARLLTPADILVLVRQKKEAWKLHRRLTARGIPATVGGAGGLLRTREAREVLLFLKALESPRSLSAVQALTWTSFFEGANAEVLAQALNQAQEDHQRGAYLRAFRRVAASMEPTVTDGGGLERLLEQPGGRRKVTNAEQVLELLQERSHRGEIFPGNAALALETWIESRLQEDEVDLRRDGETPTLRLLTIHASKGLESPVVLHGWTSDTPIRTPEWVFVEGGVDALVGEDALEYERQQALAEQWRLSYVALTRARSHQVMIGSSESPRVPEPVASGPHLRLWKAPQDEPDLRLESPIIGLEQRHPWVESHSGLWKRAQREPDAAVTLWEQSRPRRSDEGVETELSAGLPAGPAFGELVHAVLEQADFRGWAPEAAADRAHRNRLLVEAECQRYRTELGGKDHSRSVELWLAQALSFPFELGSTSPLVFNQLAPEQCRRELEFHLPLSLPRGRPRIVTWNDQSLSVHPGYLTGWIDLILRWEGKLYIVDWKTNRLSADQELASVMREHGYDLQAQWYWEAARRLSQVQKQSEPWGGVLYVFLRGQGTGPASVFLSPQQLDSQTSLRPLLEENRL